MTSKTSGKNPNSEASASDPVLEPMLRFHLQQREYAIRLSAVAGVGDLEQLREIPGAPLGVLGLTEWHGRLLTVLDLPRLAEDSPRDALRCLIRLAAPHDGTALFVPARLRLGMGNAPAANDARAAFVPLEIDGAALRFLEPVHLLDRMRAAADN